MANQLKHWGVLGMKWGVRRARSGNTSSPSSDHTTVSSLRTKKLNELSNDDLKKLTTRLQLERQYKDLTKRNTTAGERIVTGMLSEVGKEAFKVYVTKPLVANGIPVIRDAVTSGVEQLLKRTFGQTK